MVGRTPCIPGKRPMASRHVFNGSITPLPGFDWRRWDSLRPGAGIGGCIPMFQKPVVEPILLHSTLPEAKVRRAAARDAHGLRAMHPTITGAGKQLAFATASCRKRIAKVSISMSEARSTPRASARGRIDLNDSANHS